MDKKYCKDCHYRGVYDTVGRKCEHPDNIKVDYVEGTWDQGWCKEYNNDGLCQRFTQKDTRSL